MKLINFTTKGGQYIILEDGSELDIHNDFELNFYTYAFEQRTFKLVLKKRTDDWVQPLSFNSLSLNFVGVDVVRTRESEIESLTKYPGDERTISIIGLTTKDDSEFLGYISEEALDDSTEYALAIQTETSMAFVIHAESVVISTE